MKNTHPDGGQLVKKVPEVRDFFDFAYPPNPLSRLRRQLSQRESQVGLSAAVHLIEAGLAPLTPCCGDFY